MCSLRYAADGVACVLRPGMKTLLFCVPAGVSTVLLGSRSAEGVPAWHRQGRGAWEYRRAGHEGGFEMGQGKPTWRCFTGWPSETWTRPWPRTRGLELYVRRSPWGPPDCCPVIPPWCPCGGCGPPSSWVRSCTAPLLPSTSQVRDQSSCVVSHKVNVRVNAQLQF